MMANPTNLKSILNGLTTLSVKGDLEMPVMGVTEHSQHVTPGCVFVAIKGISQDGHQFIPLAVSQGAVAVVCEYFPDETYFGVTLVQVN